jgi:methanogenic corrinoid protein MtbC1
MSKRNAAADPGLQPLQRPAIRFLVESALRRISTAPGRMPPRDRGEWVEHLARALMSEAETSHSTVIASLMANGYDSRELFDYFIPAVSRRLGELWVRDEASFVDVTVGAGRLQALFRTQSDGSLGRIDRTIPLGETFLMVVPDFEDHSLGAFVAANQLRRHGVWVHLAIGLTREELADLLASRRFAALGMSAATAGTLAKVTLLIDYLRKRLDKIPPIVVGGRAVTEREAAAERTGADFGVRTAREAVERLGLASVASALTTADPI